MFILNEGQQQAKDKIINFLKSSDKKIFLLYGSAGTGKTTLITQILKESRLKIKKVVLSATTNKAVSVIQKIYEDFSNNVHFCTIHKLLKIRRSIDSSGNEHYSINLNESPDMKKKSLYFYDIIVIDEASMINEQLSKDIVSLSSSIKGKIIFIGDRCQLPPINEAQSKVFSYQYDKFELTKVERSKNNIVKYSNSVRETMLNNVKINYKAIRGNGVELIKKESDWLESYIDLIKHFETNSDDTNIDYYKKSIVLAYTNARCNQINNNIRNKIFNNKNKYNINELIVFNNFYSNESKKYYSSEHCIIKDIKESYYKIEEFPLDCLFNLKLNIKKDDSLKLSKKIDDDYTCPICYENEREFGETKCGHSFCIDCIHLWLKKNKTCPYCRMQLTDDKIIIKNDDTLTKFINNFIEKVNGLKYKIYEIKTEYGDTINVVHESDSINYKSDLNYLNSLLVNYKKSIKKGDKLINILLKRLWEFYYFMIIDKFADISYGYCITVHKSQGSTYDNVYVDLPNIVSINQDKLQTLQCLYTAITRAANNLKIYTNK